MRAHNIGEIVKREYNKAITHAAKAINATSAGLKAWIDKLSAAQTPAGLQFAVTRIHESGITCSEYLALSHKLTEVVEIGMIHEHGEVDKRLFAEQTKEAYGPMYASDEERAKQGIGLQQFKDKAAAAMLAVDLWYIAKAKANNLLD